MVPEVVGDEVLVVVADVVSDVVAVVVRLDVKVLVTELVTVVVGVVVGLVLSQLLKVPARNASNRRLRRRTVSSHLAGVSVRTNCPGFVSQPILDVYSRCENSETSEFSPLASSELRHPNAAGAPDRTLQNKSGVGREHVDIMVRYCLN